MGGGEEERREIIASFPNLGDNIPCFISARSACECVRLLPEDSHAMATASDGQARLFVKGGGRRKGFPPPLFSPFPRQTCGEAAELSRGHTTHIASAPIHPMRRLKIAHPHPRPPPPLPPLVSPSLYSAYMSISLLAATCQHSHQSLCLSASPAESMGCPWSRC